MAVPKAVGYMVVILLLYNSAQNQVQTVSEGLNSSNSNTTVAATSVTTLTTPIGVTSLTTTSTPATEGDATRPAPKDIDVVIDMRIPVTSVPAYYIESFRNYVANFRFPYIISQTLSIEGVNITTVCNSSSTTNGLQCKCEDYYAWSCDKCNLYSPCDLTSNPNCLCLNLPSSIGEFCQPITNVSSCPPTTVITSTPTVPINISTTTPSMPAPQEMSFSFSIATPFDPSFNDPSSKIYQDSSASISAESQKHITTFVSAKIIQLRSGSTVVDYNVIASSFQKAEIDAMQSGIFTQMVEKNYPVIYDSSETLKFDPPEVLFGKSVIVKCGPPPQDLNFGTIWTPEWTRNGIKIMEDTLHHFSVQGGEAHLNILNFFNTDNGRYECNLKGNRSSVFRQKSNGEFIAMSTPVIEVTPVTRTVECTVGNQVKLQCSVNSPYTVEFKDIPNAGTGANIFYDFFIADCQKSEVKFTCQETTYQEYNKDITLMLTNKRFTCISDPIFGSGILNEKTAVQCSKDNIGEKTAVCKESGKWEDRQDNCILIPISDLLKQSQFLTNNSLPLFLDELSTVTVNFTEKVVQSPANIDAIVKILDNVANVTSIINRTSMEDILLTAGVLTIDGAKNSWDFLNSNDTRNNLKTSPKAVSSRFLLSLETVTRGLTDDSFDISTNSILLNKTTFTDTFDADFNSSVVIDIPESDGVKKSITVMTFASLDNILPARDKDNSSLFTVNGRVVLVQSSGTINNISFTFDIINNTLGNPQCVFWNFTLFNGLGGWDDQGCELVSVNTTVTCHCNHLTSFSILMSPYSPRDPVLDFITYIGVGISMASLVICLIIEAYIWQKIRKNNTSYLRHVSIVNIAVSLLIANIWFIIGAAISDAKEKNPPACTAATFFIHLFYLALFFWMLASALLLLYRTLSVFDGGLSKKSMLAIGFSLGYGVPLIIVIITIAVTSPREAYIQETGVCWLNWYESKALLAFVIPALTIVVINLLILLVVLYKMLRRRAVGDAAQAAERHVLLVIARSLAVLTPFFGLTWALGVGTMTNPKNRGIHISFAFFNSLQGFFILLFGTLLDRKVLSEIAIKSQTSKSGTSGTRSTSAGDSSSGGLGFFRNRKKGRDVYNVSSSVSGASPSISANA